MVELEVVLAFDSFPFCSLLMFVEGGEGVFDFDIFEELADEKREWNDVAFLPRCGRRLREANEVPPTPTPTPGPTPALVAVTSGGGGGGR